MVLEAFDHSGRSIRRTEAGAATRFDGSLALESPDLEGNTFLAVRFPDAAATSSPLPEFLLDRTKLRELFLLPNGRGYALRQQGADHALEVFSSAGEKCGELTTPERPAARS